MLEMKRECIEQVQQQRKNTHTHPFGLCLQSTRLQRLVKLSACCKKFKVVPRKRKILSRILVHAAFEQARVGEEYVVHGPREAHLPPLCLLPWPEA